MSCELPAIRLWEVMRLNSEPAAGGLQQCACMLCASNATGGPYNEKDPALVETAADIAPVEHAWRQA